MGEAEGEGNDSHWGTEEEAGVVAAAAEEVEGSLFAIEAKLGGAGTSGAEDRLLVDVLVGEGTGGET